MIYRPPHSVKDFLQQFTDFISNIVKFDHFLLVGDFNIQNFKHSDYMLSDHRPILLSMSLPSLLHVSTKVSSMSRVYSPQFSENFSQCFTKSCSHLFLDSLLADKHLSLLNRA